jgi:hypothetical protein
MIATLSSSRCLWIKLGIASSARRLRAFRVCDWERAGLSTHSLTKIRYHGGGLTALGGKADVRAFSVLQRIFSGSG